MIKEEDETHIGSVTLEAGADIEAVVREDLLDLTVDAADLSVSLLLTEGETEALYKIFGEALAEFARRGV